MNAHLPSLRAAVGATAIHDAFQFSWFGRRAVEPPPRPIRESLSTSTTRCLMKAALQEVLYSSFYCKGEPVPALFTRSALLPDRVHSHAHSILDPELESANSGRGCWQPGWIIQAAAGESVVVSNGELALTAPRALFRPETEGTFVPGACGKLRFSKRLRFLSPGYHYIHGNRSLTAPDWEHVIRIYWNLTPKGAVDLVRLLTLRLNEAALSFHLKVLKEPEPASRCDTAVLYCRQADFEPLTEYLSHLSRHLDSELRPLTPIFTKSLTRGIALAEGPPSRQSFGAHRCGILAEGLIEAHETGARTIDDRLAVIARCFAQNGIRMDEPYLNPGSADRYPFPPRPERPLKGRGLTGDSGDEPVHPRADLLLDAAAELGKQLCARAIRHGGLCTWIGAPAHDPDSSTRISAGPDLYSGTSGIGLFLAELYRATKRREFRDAAIGAVRHAVSSLDRIPPAKRLGLFAGYPGIALAADRVDRILGSGEFFSPVRTRISRCIEAKSAPTDSDWMSGKAGGIVALLALQDRTGMASLAEESLRLGDALLRQGIRCGTMLSWRTTNRRGEHHLTGLSHGAAGIGLAFAELFRVTGQTRFLQAARSAFRYERQWFDPDKGNWADLRETSVRIGPGRRRTLAFPVFWCHGAAGIALARLRAWEILHDEETGGEALTALKTTELALRSALESPDPSFCLCHGVAGNAEVAAAGREVLGSGCDDGAALPEKAALAWIRRRRDTGFGPGLAKQPAPGLMLGLAGIGLFLLRLGDPTVPSILSPTHRARVAGLEAVPARSAGTDRSAGRVKQRRELCPAFPHSLRSFD